MSYIFAFSYCSWGFHVGVELINMVMFVLGVKHLDSEILRCESVLQTYGFVLVFRWAVEVLSYAIGPYLTCFS